MGYPLNKKIELCYEYDFAIDGGAIGDIVLRNSAVNGLKSGLTITKAYVVVETALVSGSGAATIGNGTDDDGFFLDLVATAAGSYSSMSAKGGALLRLSATDVESELAVKLAADISPELVIATGAVTAGKFKLVFECINA
jgi:hypothetical protein